MKCQKKVYDPPPIIQWKRHNHGGYFSLNKKTKSKKLPMWIVVVAVLFRPWNTRNPNSSTATVTMAWVSIAVSARSRRPFQYYSHGLARPALPLTSVTTSPYSSSSSSSSLFLHATPKKRKRKNLNDDANENVSSSSIVEKKRKRMTQQQKTTRNKTTKKQRRFSYHTAVAIIPPDEAWDRLQQARHWVQDPTVHIWPPAIRLFHPFVDNTNEEYDDYEDGDNVEDDPHEEEEESLYDACIFKMAECIEQLNQTMCEITLSEWSIIPHLEAMVELWDDYDNDNTYNNDDKTKNDQVDDDAEEYQYIQKLIAREEAMGKINKAKRQAKQGGRRGSGRPRKINSAPLEAAEETTAADDNYDMDTNGDYDSKLPQNTFDGNCVIVLEPDPPSREILVRLRAALKKALAANNTIDTTFADLYSPTRSVKDSLYQTDNDDNDDDEDNDGHSARQMFATNEWRPVVPIAAVSTTAAAIPLARHLRASWDPIRFNVTDLHVLSRRRRDSSSSRSRSSSGQHGGRGRLQGEAFGCDALISFVGSEAVAMDDPIHQKLAYLVSEHGDSGGADTESLQRRPPPVQGLSTKLVLDDDDEYFSEMPEIQQELDDFKSSIKKRDKNNNDYVGLADKNDDDERNYISPALEEWLFQDDADLDDDGSVVVLGRVQFFTGSQRDYVGMPAASVLDQNWYYDREHKSKQKKGATSKKRSLLSKDKKTKPITDG